MGYYLMPAAMEPELAPETVTFLIQSAFIAYCAIHGNMLPGEVTMTLDVDKEEAVVRHKAGKFPNETFSFLELTS